mgnify:CR=1 FL=1
MFGTKKDLENIFREFQKNNMIKYYRCGKSDSDKITDITKIDNFGISLSGRHIGNQYLVIEDDETVRLDKYKHINQKLNETSIVIDLGGLYDENTIFPTTVSTIWYDVQTATFCGQQGRISRTVRAILNGQPGISAGQRVLRPTDQY